MSIVGALKFNINTFLNSQGFQQFKANLKQSMSLSQRFNEVTGSTLGKLAIGYFSISALVGQYNKAVEASNEALANETKLYAVLRAQNFRDKQIEGLKEYASELQNVGVIGDDTSYAGIKQLATFKLQEESIRKLLPRVQDLMVAEKGLNSTSADAEKWAKTLGIAVSSGQVRALKQVGVVLDEHTSKLFENANEQERVAILSKELKTRIGEQNAEFLKTPEGKITSAKNRIGDLYEVWGMSIRDTRAKFWEFIADNAEGIQDMITKVFKAGGSFVDTFMGVFRDIKKGFNALPDGAKTGLKVIGGLALATKFPLVALGLVIEDIFAAFQGKESFTEDAINALLKFTGTDYRFSDLRKGVSDFWKLWTEGADSGIEKITLTTKILCDLLDVLKGGAGILQMIWGGTVGAVWDFGKNTYKALTGDFEDMNWDNSYGNIKGGWNRLYSAGQHMNKTSEMHDNYLLEEAEKKIKQQSEAADFRRINQGKPGVPVETELMIPGSQPLGISTSIPNFSTTINYNYDNSVLNNGYRYNYDNSVMNNGYRYNYNNSVTTNNMGTKNNTVNYNSTANEYKKDTYNSTVNEYKKNNEAIKVELPTNINEAINRLNEAKKIRTLDGRMVDATKKVTTNQTVNYNPTYKTDVTINESKDGKNGFEDIVNLLRKKDKENLERIKAQVGMGLTY